MLNPKCYIKTKTKKIMCFFSNNKRAIVLIIVFIFEFVFCLLVWILKKEPAIYALEKFQKYNLTTLIPFFIAAPYAYFIWIWRDNNKKEDIKNAQRTIENEKISVNQENFHILQSWAAGYESNETMRISAIYQLRDYVNGNQGVFFKRPTLEIFRSLLEDIVPNEDKQNQFRRTTKEIEIPEYIKVIHTIIREESKHLDKNNLRNFDLRQADLRGVDFSSADLTGSNFYKAVLDNADFSFSKLYGANFTSTFCAKANFQNASFGSIVNLDESVQFLENENLIFIDKTDSQEGMMIRTKEIAGTVFSDSYLFMADFRNVEMRSYVSFNGVYFRNTIWIDGTVIPYGYVGIVELPIELNEDTLAKMKKEYVKLDESKKTKQK